MPGPKVGEDLDEYYAKKRIPCETVRDDLLACLLRTDCCKKEKRTPRECLKDIQASEECQNLRIAFFECKRSILDMRTRFRGRKDF